MEALRFGLKYLKRGYAPTYAKWILRYILRGKWALGSEMAYWEIQLRRYPSDWHQPMFKDVYFALETLRQTFNEHPMILEMGPGPRSRLTEGYEKKLFNLVSVDPLAEEYKRYFNGKPFLVSGRGENLDRLFPKETFHMTYASNALDHTQDPPKCFTNLYELTKPHGLIMIQGNENEGTRMGWVSLHQHDLYLDDLGMLQMKDKNGEQTPLTDGFNLQPIHLRLDILAGNPWFSITYRRLKDEGG